MKKATHDCMRMMAAMVTFAAVAVSLAGAPEFKIGTVGNPTAIHIQRTMKALEESTAENPSTVRVLFYGQSIVAQGWTGVLMKMLREKYPTVNFVWENRAIGGFTSPALSRTAWSDLYPYYPDLLFFHVYGPIDKYEEIVRNTRAMTSAEIVLWSSHLSKGQDPKKMLEERDKRTKDIMAVAERNKCMFVDLNRKWSEMLVANGWAATNLLADGIHMSGKTDAFKYYAGFIGEEMCRIPGTSGEPEVSGTITELPAASGASVKVAEDGAITLSFSGNRVVAVSSGANFNLGAGAAQPEADIFLDGKPVSSYKEMWYCSRASTLVSWMPMLYRVTFNEPPVKEKWTLTYIDGTDQWGNPVHYKVEGSVTGFDGEGWSTNAFTSTSGRAVIAKDAYHFKWQYDYFVKKNVEKKPELMKKAAKPGDKITWQTLPLFADPFAAKKAGERSVLVQNCSNGRHVLEIRPKVKGGKVPGIEKFIIYSPAPSEVKVLHVDSEKGDDSGDGSATRPFKTPGRAKAAVRTLVKSGASDGVAVELEGVFTGLKAPILDLGKEDGGVSPSAPVVWRAGARGALFTGACRLTEADFRPVSGAARERLKPAVRDKVYACDLAKFGVGELKPLPAKFGTWSEMELISSGRAMTIARYPDSGWLEISNVVDRGVAPKDLAKGEWEFGVRGGTFEYVGDEPRRWDVSKGVFVFGFWCYDWASDTLRLAKIDTEKRTFTTEGVHTYGIGKPGKWAKAKPRYFVYNLLEELDAPGEWYVDRETRTLYFYPTADGFKDVALSLAKDPLVRVRNTSNVVLKGLEFRFSTGQAVNVSGSDYVTLDGLKASWLSRAGIGVWGGSNVTVQNCRLWQIGSAGLNVHGGDRKSLTKCGHRVCNNDIGYCGRLSRISGPCLSFGGCGVTVESNYFHDTPYIAVSYGGNEHLVQYNEIECAMLEAGDGAGMYTGRDWGSRGNVLRWNYLHHFGKDGVALREAQGRPSGCEALKNDVMVEGIYLDDCDSGETIYGNLFYKAGRAMFTGGGRDNKWSHNLVLDCTTAVHFDTRGLQRARPGSGIKDGWDLLAKIEACAYTSEPWASRYPELIGIMQKEPLLPIGTEYVSNVAVNCGYFYNSWGNATKFLQERAQNRGNVSVNARDTAREAREYPQTNAVLRVKLEMRNDDALSRVAATVDPRKVQDLPEFRAAFPWFPRIPVERIGLANWPHGEAKQ